MDTSADIIIIGAGIAGASLAHQLSSDQTSPQSIILLEAESQPGYHATGRSAAVYLPTYGPPAILGLTRASGDFFHNPPKGFCDHEILSPRATMMIAKQDDDEAINEALDAGMKEITTAQATDKTPAINTEIYTRFLLDEDTYDIDVDMLLAARLKHFKANGGQFHPNAQVTAISFQNDLWTLTTKQHQFTAPIIINAAGAWVDEIAALAGLEKLGIQPKRRSAALIDVSSKWDVSDWPFIVAAGDTFYFRPIGKKLMISPADQTPVDPHDAWADDMALAHAMEDFQQATGFEVTHLEHTWAGLRTFARDGLPVIGFDPRAKGFFWLAGQGGYGIETSPAISRFASALINQKDIPADIKAFGINNAMLLPDRLIS